MRHRLLPLVLAAAALVSRAGAEDDAPPAPRTVEIDRGGGAKIAAEVSEPKGGGETRPAVVAIHGEGADHAMWKPLAERLVRCGVSVVAIDVKPPAADAATPANWTGAVDDALAAVKWARGTLLADGKKIALVGAGAGGNVAAAAARKDAGVVGVLLLGPLPGAGGVEGAVVGWDGRPIALVAGAKSASLPELRKMAAPLAKQPRAETILVEGAAGYGADLLSGSPDAVLETAQWVHGWLGRPAFDLAHASNVRESSGPGHIVMSQSSCGCGIGGGGGIACNGQRAPQEIDAIGVLVCPDPKATSLVDGARRLTLTPGKGKTPTVNVKVERWAGKAWKAEGAMELSDCGGFGKDANVSVYAVWLSPRVLGVKPFSSVAIASCFVDKGRFTFEDEKKGPGGVDLGSFGGAPGAKERKPFKSTDPSTWDEYELR
jgi:dienelactone hydrolase